MFTYNNLVGDVSLSLVDPLSWELRFLLNSSLAIDLVLTSGDFSECSDSEFSCSVLTDRPLKAIMYRMILLLNAKRYQEAILITPFGLASTLKIVSRLDGKDFFYLPK